jgi:hypothetical protein
VISADEVIGGERPPARLDRPVGPSPALAEDRQIDLNAIVEQYRGVLLGGLSVVVLLLLVLDLIQARRIRRLGRRLDGLTRGTDEQSLESILSTHLDKVYTVGRELDQLSARSAVLEADSRKAIQKVGLVRFNPFEDTGGNQSFALALTDAAGDGFVVSSLHSRTGTRVYAKAITGGRSDGALSAEEAEALRLAMASGPRADRTGRAGGPV